MKAFLLKLGNVATYGVMATTGIYSIVALLYGMLPAEATEPIITALSLNADAIVPVGISSVVTTGTLIVGKVLGKTMNLKLKASDLARRLFESGLEEKIALKQRLNEEVNSLTVDKQNQIISQNEQIIKNQTALVNLGAIQAQRNIKSGLVPQVVKDQYQAQLNNLEAMEFDMTPITRVVTEQVEVVKEVVAGTTDRL